MKNRSHHRRSSRQFFIVAMMIMVASDCVAFVDMSRVDTLFPSQPGLDRPLVSCVAVGDSVIIRSYYNNEDRTIDRSTVYHSTDGGAVWDSLSIDSVFWMAPLPSSYCSTYGRRAKSGPFIHIFADGTITEIDHKDKGLPSALSVEYTLPDPRVKGRYFAVCYRSGSASNVHHLFVLDDLNSSFREIRTPYHSTGFYRKLELRFDYSDLDKIIIDVDGNNPINADLPYERHISSDLGNSWTRVALQNGTLFGLFRRDHMFTWTTQSTATGFKRNPALVNIRTGEADTLDWTDPIEAVLSSWIDTSKYRVQLLPSGNAVTNGAAYFFVQVNDPQRLIAYAFAIPDPDLGLLPRLFFGVYTNDFGDSWTMYLEPFSYDSARYERDMAPVGVITNSGTSFTPFNHYLRDTNGLWKTFLRSYVLSSVLVTSVDEHVTEGQPIGIPFPQPAHSLLHLPIEPGRQISTLQMHSTCGQAVECSYTIDSSHLVIDTSGLPSGVYILSVHDDTRISSHLVRIYH